jgi:hypothetical protein
VSPGSDAKQYSAIAQLPKTTQASVRTPSFGPGSRGLLKRDLAETQSLVPQQLALVREPGAARHFAKITKSFGQKNLDSNSNSGMRISINP